MSELDFTPKPGIPSADGSNAGAPAERASLAEPTARRSEDDFDRALRPKRLDEFVGQARVCEQLGVFIDAARQRDEALDHALFAGPPGLGKCVTPDTMIFSTHGMVPIGSLGEIGGDSWQPITRPVSGLYGTRTADYFYDNGYGETLRVTTRSGYRVEGTPNHPLLVRDAGGRLQFRRLSELRAGDEVAVRLGAQVFGSSTQLHVEGVGMPTLNDAANIPDTLTPEIAHCLGLMLAGGRLAPASDGLVYVTQHPDRMQQFADAMLDAFCVRVVALGAGPLGERRGVTSLRLARFMQAMGMTRDGFASIPDPIYRAPRTVVAEFLRGVFWGTEHAPTFHHRDRTVVAHLQLMFTNFGIESAIVPANDGWCVEASTEPAGYDGVDAEQLGELEQFVDQPSMNHGHDVEQPSDAPWREAVMSRSERAARHLRSGQQQRQSAGFGMTAAGVLVAMSSTDDTAYRRGSARADDIIPVQVDSLRLQASVSTSTISVAEVEPRERGRAITRDRILGSDVRALAVRSVRSRLDPDHMVELIWQPIVSIEPGAAHTVDISVPDGHTFSGNGIICHNTTLATVVANELGSTLHTTSGPALEKKADVAAILTSLGPRDVLFIDEIHRVSTAIEEVLYTAMEDYQIDIVLGQGPAARTIRLELEPFTLVGATTRTGLLTTPLRDRFGITQRLEYYDAHELVDIVMRSSRLLGITIDDAAAHEIARRGRGTPRIANRLLRRVRDVAQVRHSGDITLDITQEALDLVDIDAVGLDRIDRQILENILSRFGGGPVGLSTLSVSVGEEPHTIEDVYEPFLIQQGFIQRTPRGRIITPLGRNHIAGHVAHDIAPEGLF